MISFVGDWSPIKPPSSIVAEGWTVGNLECAFFDGPINSSKAYSSILSIDGMSNVGSGGFGALSLANNHVNDADNFERTYVELRKRFPNIQFFGTMESPYAEFGDQDDGRIVVIGCLEPCRSRGRNIFRMEDVTDLIQKLKAVDVPPSKIYVYPHWGKEGEYTRYPAPWQLCLAREWINAGADGVFGSHSHVPQGREYYQRKPIYYSLGNFDFDHPEGKQYEGTKDRLIVDVDVETGSIVGERFNSNEAKDSVEQASVELGDWTTWKWAKKIGPLYLRKNTASWKLRLKKNLIKTLPKFLVWQVLPKTLLFRIASLCR